MSERTQGVLLLILAALIVVGMWAVIGYCWQGGC